MLHATHQPQSLQNYISRLKPDIDAELERQLRRMMPEKLATPGYADSLLHAVLGSGKRLRPIMALATYQLFRSDLDFALPAATAVELIHTGSLMLDDLPCMDNAEYRRGEKTNHTLFGESVTILSSAALWVEAFRIISELDSPDASVLVSVAARSLGGTGLVQGQLLDLAAFNSVQTEAELEACYVLKTSVLFTLATSIGAMLGGATEAEQGALNAYAQSFGVAYQIRDDILDATQTTEEAGKDTGIDAKNHKPTYVSLLGLEGAQDALGRKIAEAEAQLATLSHDTLLLGQLVNQLAIN